MEEPKILDCTSCSNQCKIQNLSKEGINFCPFCGEEIALLDEAPLLTTFDEHDDYED